MFSICKNASKTYTHQEHAQVYLKLNKWNEVFKSYIFVLLSTWNKAKFKSTPNLC